MRCSAVDDLEGVRCRKHVGHARVHRWWGHRAHRHPGWQKPFAWLTGVTWS